MTARSLFDKLWDAHVIARREDGTDLLWVDRHFVHEGSHHAFRKIGERNLDVAHPDLTFGVTDHYIPTRPLRDSDASASQIIAMIDRLDRNTERHGIRHFRSGDPRQGIVHVIGPELGLTLPGLLIVCGDSHTSTHGAFGTIGFGIGATEVAHVLAAQTIWQKRPKSMRITVNGTLGTGVTAKDIALHWIALLGADGARGHAIEYAGSTIRALSMEGRMTLCNMSIEGGGRFGMVAPDETTFDYVTGRSFAPIGAALDAARAYWNDLRSDDGAAFDKEIIIDAADIAPTVTWGTSPEEAMAVTGRVPDPDARPDRAEQTRDALAYMGLEAGAPLDGIAVDRVFIGSCTNARLEDLRAAAAILRGRKARVPGLVSPGSTQVKALAEAEGLDRVFTDAGLEWVSSGCSMCVGMNGDLARAGERCASTTNRNFKGRQGKGARMHLMSPAMVAAAAVAGCITDVRRLAGERGAA